jgi:uncharacterized phage protein gp47/JayE
MPGPYPLSTLSVTIDQFGIRAPVYEDILQSLMASYRQIYGSDVALDADTQDGQWLAVQAQAMHDSNQALIAGYLAYSPTTAQGIGLSSVVKINGIARLPVSNSTVDLRLVGVTGTIITNGQVGDTYGMIWALPAQVIIPVEGEIMVTGVCTTPGAVMAAANTVTNILTMTPGWQSANNPLAAFPGLPIETDAQLRKRQTFSTSLPAITPREAIAAAVANVPNVGRVFVHDNDTHFYDSELVPPHSIAVIVEGGAATDIAQAILIKKNTGCGTYGNVEQVVYDQHGVPLTVNFFYLLEVPIYVIVNLQPLLGYIETTGTLIADTLVLHLTKLGIGENVYASRLAAPASLAGDEALEVSGMNQQQLDLLARTFVIRNIWIGTEPNPTTSDDVIIDFNAAATATRTNISVVLSPVR